MMRHLRTIGVAVLFAACLATQGATQVPQPERVTGELRNLIGDAGIDGRFGERRPGAAIVFQPQRFDWPQLPVTNPDSIGPLSVGPVIRVRGKVDDAGLLTVSGVGLPGGPPASTPISAVFDPFRTFLERVMRRPAARANPNPHDLSIPKDQQEADAAIKKIIAAYQTALAQNKDADRDEIVARWDFLRAVFVDMYRDSRQVKAIYGSLDNYPPESYEQLYAQTPSAVAIAIPTETNSRCSGVVVAKDLVLTAAHCLSDLKTDPTKLEVWVGYLQTILAGKPTTLRRHKILGLAAPTQKELPALMLGKFGSTLLDYVILQVAPTDAGRSLPSARCIRSQPPNRGDALYGLGYPQGYPLKVHDNARVYLPFRLSDDDEFTMLRLNVEADVRVLPERPVLMREFDDSYVPVSSNLGPLREFRHINDNRQPRMGVVADTFHGDSGGPMFDRERNQCVVGILNAGVGDTGLRRRPNWKEHERVLPITAILEDLDRRGLKNSLGLKIE